MAEGIVGDLASKALESLAKLALNEASSWWGARDELKKLRKTIETIKARLCDAEMRQEDKTSEVIKLWLRRLKQVLYQADDLFDEVLTLDRQKQKMEKSALAKVGILFSKSGPLLYNRKLANEIKSIRKELDVIKADMDGLNLRVLVPEELKLSMERLYKKRQTGSYVKEEDIVGRKDDKKLIIDMLFDPVYNGERVTVIPIVGFGGLGKTTLAQLVFNDERVQKHFDLTTWACVPEVDDRDAVIRRVYQSLTKDKDSGKLLLDQIQSGIRESVINKKYLLVLDDIWDDNRDRWLNLLSLLECGGIASKVIVTTRLNKVAANLGTISEPYRLGILTPEESWDLFKRRAFKSGQEESNPALTQIGKEIVASCGNVPLAINVVGSLLYSKNTEKEWKLFRDQQLSKAKMTADSDIMPVLKLSYDYLPPALKQCFRYCSLFPKDHEFNKDDLVRLWAAQAYFDSSDRDIGVQLFLELLGRNLFQEPEEDDNGNVISCKMHDLVHDLAQHMAVDESMLLGESRMEITDGLIHVSVAVEEADGWETPLSLADNRMRSLLFVMKYTEWPGIKESSSLERVILNFKHLRVLHLKGMGLEMVPNSIGRSKHLRYLNLANNYRMKCLPDSITRLENLQTLNLDECDKLEKLPRDFANLANLKHLILATYFSSRLIDLPSGFEKMKSLQELNRFIVGESNGIDSLPALNLKGELQIDFRIWRCNAIMEAQMANMKNNQHLTDLKLEFLFEVITGTPESGDIERMLAVLQLPPNLKKLDIDGYKGDGLPRKWLDYLSNLVEVSIRDCSNCRVLPHFKSST